MQTMYYKTSNFIQHTGNIIDLTELRRRQAAAQRDSLARQPEVEAYLPEVEPGFRPVVLTLSPEERRRARRERRAWRLDACASAAVIVMTLAFLLRMVVISRDICNFIYYLDEERRKTTCGVLFLYTFSVKILRRSEKRA